MHVANRTGELPTGSVPASIRALDQSLVPYIPVFDEEDRTSSIIDAGRMKADLVPLVSILDGIGHAGVRNAFTIALSWHAEADRTKGPGRFPQYWAAVEMLGTYFYQSLPAHLVSRPSPEATQLAVLKAILDANSGNFRKLNQKLDKLVRPSARTKLKAVLSFALGDAGPHMEALFGRPNGEDRKPLDGVQSLYQIRNDIAHGNKAAYDVEYFGLQAGQCSRYRSVTSDVLRSLLLKAPRLEEAVANGS